MKTIKYSNVMFTLFAILFASTESLAQQAASEKCKINSSSFTATGGSETITYTYNAKNEPLKETNSDGSGVEYTYDNNEHIIAKTETKNGRTTVFNYSYDNNRLKKENFTIDTVTYTTAYTYDDGNGNLLSISMTSDAKSYPKNELYTYADYTEANPKTIYFTSTAVSGEVAKRKHTYEYDANGNILKDIAYDFSAATNAYVETGKGEYRYDATTKSVMQLTAVKKIVNPTVAFETGLVYFGGAINFVTGETSYKKCKNGWAKVSEVVRAKTATAKNFASAWTTTTTNYRVDANCTITISKWGNGKTTSVFTLTDCK